MGSPNEDEVTAKLILFVADLFFLSGIGIGSCAAKRSPLCRSAASRPWSR